MKPHRGGAFQKAVPISLVSFGDTPCPGCCGHLAPGFTPLVPGAPREQVGRPCSKQPEGHGVAFPGSLQACPGPSVQSSVFLLDDQVIQVQAGCWEQEASTGWLSPSTWTEGP